MNTTVKNIFGVAAAILVLLGLNYATPDNALELGSGDDTATVVSNENAVNNDNDDPVQSAENRSVASLKDFNDAIVDIAEKTNPAVVTITTKRTQEIRMINPFSQFFGNPQGDDQVRERVQRGLGSGVIVSEDGYIITNNHVIDNSDEIKVRMYNGDEMTAELIGTDPQTDIAVLQIDAENLPAVSLGNSDELKVGSFVLAIGSPLSENLAHTVSFGIVSAKGRSIGLIRDGRNLGYENFIQTDAAINPGNSGGALIDVNGNLVGINSAIASRSGGNDGIGFAIPINLAKRIMDDLVEDGEVSRGYLGMYFGGEVDQTMAKALGLGETRGIIVGKVEEDGPAAKAGLEEQDIIISLEGQKVRNWESFRTQIASLKPGDKINLGIIRDDKNIEVEVTLGKREQESLSLNNSESAKDLEEKLGFAVQNLNTEIRSQLNIENDFDGVVVGNIQEGSNAYERGLRRGDVIIEVKRESISSVNEFYEALDGVEDNVVLLTVLRSNLKQYIAFEL